MMFLSIDQYKQSSMSEVQQLKEWYSNLIKKFREEYAKLTDDEKKHLSNIDKYTRPCQVEVFWLKNPGWQLIVRTNFRDRTDGEIIINGPYDTHDFLEAVDKIIMEPRWEKQLDHPEEFFSFP